jgi:hypothetical protein
LGLRLLKNSESKPVLLPVVERLLAFIDSVSVTLLAFKVTARVEKIGWD